MDLWVGWSLEGATVGCVVAYGNWKGARHRKLVRLERAANGGELRALDVGFMELGFALCCIWARLKINYGRFRISNG
jgi:hypothetical protein